MKAPCTTPAIMSAPMVRALLDGRKTQTRRLVTSQWANLKMHHELGEQCFIWVREAWQLHSRASDLGKVVYRASEGASNTEFHRLVPADLIGNAQPRPFQEGWKPSIHMPRWASRLTLEVTDVRLHRLQDISEEDAVAEGFELTETDDDGGRWYSLPEWSWQSHSATQAYSNLWASLHGKGSWEQNPEVIAVSFRVHQQNIDVLLAERDAA